MAAWSLRLVWVQWAADFGAACGMQVGMELGHRLAMGADPWVMHGAMLLGMKLGMTLRFVVPMELLGGSELGAGKLGESRR